MVEHHLRYAIRTEHTMDLANCSFRIRRVMQDAIRIDRVEAFITKRQVLGIGDHERADSAIEFKTVLRDLDRTRREVDTDAARTTTRKLQQVCAHATSDLQQTCAAKIFKPHKPRHPRRVFRIPVPLDRIEELARALLMLPTVVGPTRILTPLLARA